MPSRCIDLTHRHITFTIPSCLWHFLQKDKTLLNDLFDAASFTILSWFNVLSKMESFIPGIVCTLHTFGRDLKWNPHIYIIVTEGAMVRLTPWKSFDFLTFDMLRKSFITKLLFNLSKKISLLTLKKLNLTFTKRTVKVSMFMLLKSKILTFHLF